MKKWIFWALMIVLIISSSCSQNTENGKVTLCLNKASNIEITTAENGVKIKKSHLFTKNKEEYIACLMYTDPEKNSIGIYNLSDGSEFYYSDLNKFKGYNISSFRFIDFDSIFLLINKKGVHDSILLMVDSSMNIKKNIDLCSLPVRCNGKPSISRDSASYLLYSYIPEGLLISGHKIYLPLSRYQKAFETNTYETYKTPFLLSLNILNGVYEPVEFTFPEYIQNKLWEGYGKYQITLGKNHYPLIAPAMSPLIIESNPDTKKSIHYYCKSKWIDTITVPLNESLKPMPYSPFGKYANNYSRILPDTFNNRYFRLLILSPPENATIEQQNTIHYGLMLMDSAFQVIAESRFDGIGVPLFYTKSGLLFHDYQKSSLTQNKILLNTYEVEVCSTDPNKEAQKEEKKPEGNLYFQKNSPLSSRHSALIVAIPVAKTCGPCLKAILQTLKETKSNPHIFTYFLFENEWEAKKFSEQYNMEDYPHVTIDKNGEFTKYIPHFVNAKLLYMEKGKTVKEMQETLENEAEILLSIKGFKGRE
ncbi:MAG: DUF4221 domain-containing protein [Bacteroidia bacterium]|nr:DUF4221 domain-containing protein [Bacteroidia bacterium]